MTRESERPAPPQSIAAPPPGDRLRSAAVARLAWLDLYRGTAVLVMIETHVCNTFLAPAERASGWFASLNYMNGWVAPAFLFIAGLAHGLGIRRRQARSAGLRRHLGRLAGVAALGYALHFPWAEIAAGRWSDALLAGTRMDILPCLAVAIAVLLVCEHLTQRWSTALVAGLMMAVVFLAPRVAHWTGAPGPLLAVVNQTTGSLFPLLPWVAFTFAGYLVSARAPSPRAYLLPVLGAGGAVFALGRADLSPASIDFFFERLAWILLFVPICGALARFAPPPVLFASRESLVMYVAHLLIISALAGLRVPPLGIAATAGLFAVVLAATFAATWSWRRFKAGKHRHSS
ncbi:MAG: hypothetical protein QOE70_6677 [Chthoniobacter sp.]|nr:hypothetical protein [Chthoniobacter sp.]